MLTATELLSLAQKYQEGMTAFLQDLVRIRSVNGRDTEEAVAQRVVEEADRLHLAAHLVGAEASRPNALVEWGNGPAGFVLVGHLDTVTEGATPFGGEREAVI